MTGFWNEERGRYEVYNSLFGDMVEAGGGRGKSLGEVSYPGYVRMSVIDEDRVNGACQCCHESPCICSADCGMPEIIPTSVDDGIDRTSETPPGYEPPRSSAPRQNMRPQSERPKRPH